MCSAQQWRGELERWSREANERLLAADDAAHDAEQEAGFAEAELGKSQGQAPREAVTLARDELKEAFAIRRALDDAEPEDESARLEMLQEIARRAESALTVVNEERQRIEQERDIEGKAPQWLDELPGRLAAIEARFPAAAEILARLAGHAESNWAAVRGHLDEARRRVALIRGQVESGKKAISAGDHRGAAHAARAARETAAQAENLLDAIERTEQALLELQRRLARNLEAAAVDVTAARQAVEAGRVSGFDAKVREAEEALEQAQQLSGGGQPDVALASHLVARASASAARVLAGVRSVSDSEVREAQWLEASLADAEASVTRARDYIAPRRDSVQATARTRLAHAEHYLEIARSLYEGDRGEAIAAARKAEMLANVALARAQEESGFGGVRATGSAASQSPTDLAREIVEAIANAQAAGAGDAGPAPTP